MEPVPAARFCPAGRGGLSVETPKPRERGRDGRAGAPGPGSPPARQRGIRYDFFVARGQGRAGRGPSWSF